MKTSQLTKKKVGSKINNIINISKYLSKIISSESKKSDSKNIKIKAIGEYSETKLEKQSRLLAKKEMEIKTLKLKCEKLQEENNKYLLQKNLFENMNKEDTSSNFPLKKEIKELWEKFARIDILNNFIDFENEPEIIYHIISELFLLSYKIIKEKSELKFKEILKIMGIKNSSVIIKDIELRFKHFIKEHLKEIFKDLQNNKYMHEYKEEIKNIFKENILNNINNINKEELYNIFCEILEQNEFNEMIKDINDLILIAQYNEPSLYFNIVQNTNERKITLIQIQNKKNYIIPNDSNNRNIKYIIILNPPELKEGIYYFKDLKKIVMPFNGNNSNNSTIKKEIDNSNKVDILNNSITNHKLINIISQKKDNHLTNNKENKIETDKLLEPMIMFTSRESKEDKNNDIKNLDIYKCPLNKKIDNYWKTLNDENLNYFENFEIKKEKDKHFKIINISNEKIKKNRITRRKKNSLTLKDINNNMNRICSFNSEEITKTDVKKKLIESEYFREMKNKNKLIHILKIPNAIKNIYKNSIKKSSRRFSKGKCKSLNKQNKYQNESKKYMTKVINGNNNCKNKIIKKHYKAKKSNLFIEEVFPHKELGQNYINNDIKCKIKNFNINYINIDNSENILGERDSNIFTNSIKIKYTKENNINKNNFYYFPIDEIQKIIDTNANRKKSKISKNIKNINDEYNKIINKNIINKNYVQKKIEWIKKENSLILFERKNNSNNLVRKAIIESNRIKKIPSYYKNKNRKTNFEKYKVKNKINNVNDIRKKRSTTVNNFRDSSKINTTINSAKKIGNNTSELIFKNQYYKNIRKNFESKEKNQIYIKLIKNRKTNIKDYSERKISLNNIKLGKNIHKDIKETKNSKNNSNNLISKRKYKNKKSNNKSTSNILNNNLINKI